MGEAFGEAQELRYARQREEHIAQQLGISIEVLSDYPYKIEKNVGDSLGKEGVVYGWRIMWDDVPPKDVVAYSEKGAQWSYIQAGSHGSDPDEER